MQTKTRLATLALSAVFATAFAAGPVWAEDHSKMPGDAVTKMDDAAAAEDKAAEAIEDAKVAKEKALDAQGAEDVKEEISGSKD